MTSIKTLYQALDYTQHTPKNIPVGISWKSHILHIISVIHTELGNLDFAIKIMKESLKDKSRMKYRYDIGIIYFSIGHLYYELVEIDSSKIYLKKSLAEFNDDSRELDIITSKGSLYSIQ